MNAPECLQDSGPRDGRLLATILQAGIVLLDEAQRCRFATDDACELLGAADVGTLRDDWESISTQLRLSDLSTLGARDPPLARRVDLRTARGTRALRIEVHAIDGDDCVSHLMLLRDRGRLLRADRAQLLASEAHASRHILTGLVHEAKGPLNNFYLTLSLLSSWVERVEATAIPEAMRARCRRYLHVLQTEAARLSDSVNDMHALTQPPGAAVKRKVDLCAVARDVMRALRHEATMREAAIRLDVPVDPAWVLGDAQQLQLALLGLTACVVDAANAGGGVIVGVAVTDDVPGWRVRIAGKAVALPASLAAELFRISCTGASDYPAAIAGRVIIEAHGGELTIDGSPRAPSGFLIRLPAAPLDEA